jgi:hypothetical protein
MKLSNLTTNRYAQMNRLFASTNNVMFLGPAGAGKSSIIEGYARDQGLGYVELVLSQIEAVDVRGIMVPHRKPDGGVPETVSTRTPLAALVDAQLAQGKSNGIIFFDEYYQAGLDTRKAVSQFLTSRRIGDWTLPKGWVVWGASNPPEWRAGTVAAMGHEKSRWQELLVTPEPKSWQEWAHKAGIHHLYLAFSERFPHEIFSMEPPKDRNAPHCNPRSFVAAHNYHAFGVVGNELPTDIITQELVAGAIGEGAARALFGFLKVQDVMPSPDDMLTNPKGCKIPPAERIDARYACMMQAVHYASAETNEALFDFVLRLDKEMAIASIKHFCRKDPMSINAPNIARFIGENPDSVMALAG